MARSCSAGGIAAGVGAGRRSASPAAWDRRHPAVERPVRETGLGAHRPGQLAAERRVHSVLYKRCNDLQPLSGHVSGLCRSIRGPLLI